MAKVSLVVVVSLLVGFLLVASVSAQGSGSEWITICHSQPGEPEIQHTMVIYWSALDKCLSYFSGDFVGPCP